MAKKHGYERIQYETFAYDDDAKPHLVEVTAIWSNPRPATWYDPPEGGLEDVNIHCETLTLTDEQIKEIEREFNDYVWDTYENRGRYENEN